MLRVHAALAGRAVAAAGQQPGQMQAAWEPAAWAGAPCGAAGAHGDS